MVEFKDLWRSHPINNSMQSPCLAPTDLVNLAGRPIKRGRPVFANQCAIRMGISLKYAGVKPGQLQGCVTCGAHDPSAMHYIRAHEVANALARAKIPGIEARKIIKGDDVSQFYRALFGKTGIIYIKDYWHRSTDRPGRPTGDHIDVWNGYRSSAKWLMEWFAWLRYYSNYAEAREIWFWQVR
ncbi:MAG: type VI secretion system amidase effector protein Tae4 [Pseudomonadota bacterium]